MVILRLLDFIGRLAFCALSVLVGHSHASFLRRDAAGDVDTADHSRGIGSQSSSETPNESDSKYNFKLLMLIVPSLIGIALVCFVVSIVCYHRYRRRKSSCITTDCLIQTGCHKLIRPGSSHVPSSPVPGGNCQADPLPEQCGLLTPVDNSIVRSPQIGSEGENDILLHRGNVPTYKQGVRGGRDQEIHPENLSPVSNSQDPKPPIWETSFTSHRSKYSSDSNDPSGTGAHVTRAQDRFYTPGRGTGPLNSNQRSASSDRSPLYAGICDESDGVRSGTPNSRTEVVPKVNREVSRVRQPGPFHSVKSNKYGDYNSHVSGHNSRESFDDMEEEGRSMDDCIDNGGREDRFDSSSCEENGDIGNRKLGDYKVYGVDDEFYDDSGVCASSDGSCSDLVGPAIKRGSIMPTSDKASDKNPDYVHGGQTPPHTRDGKHFASDHGRKKPKRYPKDENGNELEAAVTPVDEKLPPIMVDNPSAGRDRKEIGEGATSPTRQGRESLSGHEEFDRNNANSMSPRQSDGSQVRHMRDGNSGNSLTTPAFNDTRREPLDKGQTVNEGMEANRRHKEKGLKHSFSEEDSRVTNQFYIAAGSVVVNLPCSSTSTNMRFTSEVKQVQFGNTMVIHNHLQNPPPFKRGAPPRLTV